MHIYDDEMEIKKAFISNKHQSIGMKPVVRIIIDARFSSGGVSS